MTSSPLHPQRIWSLDLVRGLMIGLMTLSHTIHFTQSYHQPLLGILNSIINLTSFTTFMLISGAAGYLSYIVDHDSKLETRNSKLIKLLKRLFIYIIGYYLISIWAYLVLNRFQVPITDYRLLITDYLFSIITFQILLPFTEFIIPFLIFGLLLIPLKPIFKKIAPHSLLIATIGIIAYIIGQLLYQLPLNTIPDAWKAILVGQAGYYSFPILQYLSVYLLGLHLGYLFQSNQPFNQITNFIKILLVLVLFSIFNFLLINPAVNQLFNR